jgi:hypothetical protein
MNNSASIAKIENILKKDLFEWILILVLFVLSFISQQILMLVLGLTFLLVLQQKEIGALKALNLITLRTVINPGISVGITSLQNLKWLLIFAYSFYLILAYFKLSEEEKKKISKTKHWIILFSIYNMITAFLFSSLPIVAIAKLFSYSFVFIAVLIGIAYTNKYINWIEWIFKLLFLLIIPSFLLINNSLGYLRNGISFQGFTNQPNMFGILSVLFIAITLTYIKIHNRDKKYYLIVALSFFMIILSKSRTSFISSSVIILLYLLFLEKERIFKFIAADFFVVFLIIILYIERDIINPLINFLQKGHENILYSRMNQVGGLLSNFLDSPWFGNGFLVPVLSYRSFDFSFEYIVEPGNLILSVLSFSGIIGFIIFSVFILKIIFSNKNNFKKLIYLPLSTLLISMGEMVFFSTNNIGIWLYMLIAIYVVYDEETTDKYKLIYRN